MKYTAIIEAQINESITTQQAVLQQLSPSIDAAGALLSKYLQKGNKVLCCGNGGSASDAQHFAAELVGRYVRERQSLPAIALNTDTSTLTAIANDYGYEHVFAKQVEGLGRTDDILIAISTSGNSANVLAAITAAHKANMRIIALSGRGGGKIAQLLNDSDIHIRIPSNTTARVQEAHILILHCLCEIIDHVLIGPKD